MNGKVPDRRDTPNPENLPHLRTVRAGKRNPRILGESEGGRMDRTHEAQHTTAEPMARRSRREQTIGFIGRADITEEERAQLVLVGRAIARWGHTYMSVQAKGAETAVREGVKIEEGRVVALQTAVLDNAYRSLLYPNTQLLERLQKKYGDLRQRDDVTILERGQLPQFWDAIKSIFEEEGLELPA